MNDHLVMLELILTCGKWWAFLNRFCILQECSDLERSNIKMLDGFRKRVCHMLHFPPCLA